MTATTYHLWLKPTGASYEVLAGLIGALAKKLSAPVFEPHVTLLGHLEGSERDHIQRAIRLGERLEPFWIALGNASYQSEYFKCRFLKVNESAPIMKIAWRLSPMQASRTDRRHLSEAPMSPRRHKVPSGITLGHTLVVCSVRAAVWERPE
jgi:hypothetical protein